MKNIEKKWLLFLLSTVFTFYGIGYTLISKTFALNEEDKVVDEYKPSGDNSDLYDITLIDSCKLSDIIVSNGKINFSDDVYEYNVVVSDINRVEITPMIIPSDLECSFSSDFNEEGEYVVVVYENDIEKSVYKIHLTEGKIDESDEDKDYTYIFIAVILVLVLINIYRIVKKVRSK